ncbi:cellulose binding domain-containing protein [Streptomyces sp. NBC_01198]|uniref:cellulose binding domain-containing protein n=1 Tax=Streptomyces sp. NBC_01198 TaxID=2903769 RepID=UPI002E12B772|nr:cellulose binding domain-containing protein [Streptomyces sp. NBC_01198]
MATPALALAGLTGLGAPAAQAAQAVAALTAQFSSSRSGSSWTGTYTVKNGTAAAVNGWTLEFDLPAGVKITDETYGTSTVSGSHVVASPAYYNSTVSAGGSTYPYTYTFTASGPPGTPTGWLVNGDKCDSSPAVPPHAPTGVTVADATAHTVSLRWTAAAIEDFPVASYDVLRAGAVVASSATTGATVQGLSPATAYQFTVRAKDGRGNAGEPSAELRPGDRHRPADRAGRPPLLVKNLHTSGAAAKLDVVNYAFGNLDPKNLTCLNGVTKGTTADPEDPSQGDGAGDAEADYGRAFPAAQSVKGQADDRGRGGRRSRGRGPGQLRAPAAPVLMTCPALS